MKFNIKNFALQNTPESIQKLGNFLLLVAAIGVSIQSLPLSVPTIVIPAILMTTSNWMIGLGVIGKVLTKFFGEKTPADEN